MFASSQVWRLIDEDRARSRLQDWSILSREIGYGTNQDYLDNKAWLALPHVDVHGDRIHPIKDVEAIRLACKHFKEYVRQGEKDVDRHFGLAMQYMSAQMKEELLSNEKNMMHKIDHKTR